MSGQLCSALAPPRPGIVSCVSALIPIGKQDHKLEARPSKPRFGGIACDGRGRVRMTTTRKPPLSETVTEHFPDADPASAFPVVGIGASAGGLNAFRKFIAAIPQNSGIAFVLVQHLDPDHKSL